MTNIKRILSVLLAALFCLLTCCAAPGTAVPSPTPSASPTAEPTPTPVTHTLRVVFAYENGSLLLADVNSRAVYRNSLPDGSTYPGFGEVLGHPELRLVAMTEEHGMLRGHAGDIRMGDRLSIVPNHICTTVNLYDRIYLRNDSGIRSLAVEARGANT